MPFRKTILIDHQRAEWVENSDSVFSTYAPRSIEAGESNNKYLGRFQNDCNGPD